MGERVLWWTSAHTSYALKVKLRKIDVVSHAKFYNMQHLKQINYYLLLQDERRQIFLVLPWQSAWPNTPRIYHSRFLLCREIAYTSLTKRPWKSSPSQFSQCRHNETKFVLCSNMPCCLLKASHLYNRYLESQHLKCQPALRMCNMDIRLWLIQTNWIPDIAGIFITLV